MKITWAWLAGFFDGEGCLHIKMAGRGVHWSLYQAGSRGLAVLCEIQTFLAAHGIKSAIYSRPPRQHAKVTSVLTSNHLYVSRRADVMTILRALLPHLRVKRVEAADAVRFYTLYPEMVAGTRGFNLLNKEGCNVKRQRRGYRDPASLGRAV